MQSDELLVSSDEMTEYDFGDAVAPEDYDANAEGFENTPEGWHIFEIAKFQIKERHVFTGKDFGNWVGPQLRPRLVVPRGQPHAGTSQLDFLPMPTPDQPMPTALANRWANFLRACGFQPPPDRLVPPGFKLHNLIGAKCRAEVVLDEYDGKKRLKIKFFGYKPLNDTAATPGKPSRTNGNGGAQTKAPAAASAQPPVSSVDFDDL